MKLIFAIIVCVCCASIAHADTSVPAVIPGQTIQSVITELVPQMAAIDSAAEQEDAIPNLELSAETTNGKYPARTEAYWQHPANDVFDIFVYADVESDGYKEAYIGPVFKPAQWFQIGVGLGAEHPGGLRKAIWIDAGIGDLHVAAAYEHGHTGPWHEVTAVYKFHDRVGIGLMDRTELGLGPRVEYDIVDGFQLWGAILTSHGNPALTVGIKKEL